MREARLILPNADNNGQSLAAVHNDLKWRICALFGGYTATASEGGWVDPETDTLYEEAGTAYDIAAEDTAESRAKLLALARTLCVTAQQEAIYVRLPSGEVQIVPAQPMTIAA